MSKIYLSSTYQDLVEQREAVYHALRELGHDVIAMEDYVAADARPVTKCLHDVANTDVYVGVFAWRYGFVPDDGNPDGLSVTELEYRQALRSGVPRLVFLLRANASWPPPLMDSHTGQNDSGNRISRLREDLSGDRLCSDFGSSEELARKVAAAVQVYLAGRDTELSLTLDPDLSRRRFVTHMRSYAGAMSDRQAEARYVELAVQKESSDQQGYSQIEVGALKGVGIDRANYVLLGSHGSGKTTLLLREAQRLAEDGVGFPAYVSLAGFGGGDGDAVLELAAEQNRLNAHRLTSSWRQGGDRVHLLVDDVDGLAEVPAVTDALGDLHRIKGLDNSIVVAVSSQAVADTFTLLLEAQRLVVLPLVLDAVIALLDAYGRDDLTDAVRSWSGAGLLRLTVLAQPDLLSAWAQAPRGPEVMRPSLARILEKQLHRLLGEAGQTFDRDRVLAPALGLLAYRMLSSSQTALVVDDDLLDELSEVLQGIHQRYYRRRNVMPGDWSAEMFIRDVARSPVVDLDQRNSGAKYMTFSRTRFADWYAAWHVSQLARASADSALAIINLTSAGAEGALSQLVDADPTGAHYVDVIATVDRQMAERVWLAGNGGRKAPSSQQAELDRFITDLVNESARQDVDTSLSSRAREADPWRRLQVIDRWPGLETLLDLAADSHPLVRGAAEYRLLHSAELTGSLLAWDPRRSLLTFGSDGAGQATIGGLQLLSVPPSSVARLSVTIRHLEIDPFKSPDNMLRLLPVPAAAVAARLLSDSRGQDWLRSVATACAAARFSHEHATRAKQHGQLDDLAERLSSRAIEHAALAKVISEDLGLGLPDLPTTPDSAVEAAVDAYARLRYSFGPQTLESLFTAPSPNLNVHQNVGAVAGNVTSVEAASLGVESRYADGYYPADLAQINISTSVKGIKDGSVRGLVIGTLQGSAAALPIRLQVNISLSAKEMEEGTIGGVIVNRIADRYANWEVNCSISIGRMLGNNSFLGVVVREHPDATTI
jgi:hypothetical protein